MNPISPIPQKETRETMITKMLINAQDPEEVRMAIVEDGVLAELIIEPSLQVGSRGDIYKGKIVNIEPSLHDVFVDYGEGTAWFSPFFRNYPSYYSQLPQEKEGDPPPPDPGAHPA